MFLHSVDTRVPSVLPATMRATVLVLFLLPVVLAGTARGQETAPSLFLFEAIIVADSNIEMPEQKAVQMLAEEVAARSLARWKVSTDWPSTEVPVIVVGRMDDMARHGNTVTAALEDVGTDRASEGYHIRVTTKDGTPVVIVAGNDSRGVLFGCGRLLREMRIAREAVQLSADLSIDSAPVTPLRGHQLGFRPKVNSYDGWTVPMWEQYYRDLIVFGTNAVELIPPRSDDADESPHFPLRKIDMMAEMSQLAMDYGLELWIWYPALDEDYTDPATVEFALKEWGEVFARLPYISTIFVPGGDPGHTPPGTLFKLLEKQTENLHKYHPEAQMWMSPQSFDAEGTEEFYALMDAHPTWLSGIVYGPQNFAMLPDLRARVPEQYPIRRYPDITHSIASQYAVPFWDPAYALTENREVINPRPTQMQRIYQFWDHLAYGFITYSEGCNDDVNKIVWSSLGWDPEVNITDVLRQYARYFIGPELEEPFAQGLLALEQNWIGPLATNTGVETTWKQFEQMLREASPQVKLKWRFQQAIYRANYDAYNRLRLDYETSLENQAMDVLRQAERLGAAVAMDQASAILDRALTEPVAGDIRARIFEMAEALYQSIRMQHSVERYQAIAIRRGGNLDLVDYPLNSRIWLRDQFDAIRAMENEGRRLDAINALVNWDNPGPGGFYDDLGQPGAQPHLVTEPGWEVDPERRVTPHMTIQSNPEWRMSWTTFAETLRDQPLRMEYHGLDPEAAYVVKATYSGERRPTELRLMADGIHQVHDYLPKPEPMAPMEFDVPREATRDGHLVLEWNQTPGIGGAGRGMQVGEVWLIRKGSE